MTMDLTTTKARLRQLQRDIATVRSLIERKQMRTRDDDDQYRMLHNWEIDVEAIAVALDAAPWPPDNFCDEQWQPTNARCFQVWPDRPHDWCVGCQKLKEHQ